MALKVERVVDWRMHREKALGRAGRREALLLAFAPPDRLMRVSRPVVFPQALLVAARQTQLASGRAVGAQLVGHKIVGCIALLLEQLAHELHGCGSVPPALHQDVEHLALTVHRTPEPEAFASDRDSHFVQVPRARGRVRRMRRA